MKTIEDENKEASEKRKNKIRALKGEAHADDVPTFVSLDEKLALETDSTTHDATIDYAGFRASKRANAALKLEVSVSQQQQQQEQQQEQQQQQQQQQQQVTQTQQIRPPALKDFTPYAGYKNLISVQHYDHGLKTETKRVQSLFPESVLKKFKNFAGIHDSQCGGIAYITITAAKEIQKPEYLDLFSSGVYLHPTKPLDYLPDGFCLSITEGERHLPVPPEIPAKVDSFGVVIKEKSYDRREFPRLVLDYKPETKNQNKHPFRLLLIPPPKRCEFIGSPAQFNVAGSRRLFDSLSRNRGSAPNFNTIEDAKKRIMNSLRAENENAAIAMQQKLGGNIYWLAKYSSSVFFSFKLESIEANAKTCINQLQMANIAQRATLCSLMRGENPDLAPQLISRYKDIFDRSTYNDLCGLFDILFSAGCVGLEIFLQKMQELYAVDDGVTYFFFKYSFLFASPNWEEFLEDDAIKVLNKIIGLTPAQRIWWNALSSRHLQNCGWSDLADIYSAFEFFWNEYRRIGSEKMGPDQTIELPAEYCLASTRNMKVVLPRLLDVMQNARNFKEQAENLTDMDLNSNDVAYASIHQKYTLITTRMVIDGPKSSDADRIMKYNKAADSDLRVTHEDIMSLIDSYHIITQLFKFIGIQEISAPYQDYVALMNALFGNTRKGDDMFWRVSYDIICCNKIGFLSIITTSNKRGYKCNIMQQLALLKSHLTDRGAYVTNDIFTKLIKVFMGAQWLGLADAVVMAKLYYKISDPTQKAFDYGAADKQQKFLGDIVVLLKEELIEHLHVHAKNPQALDAWTFVECINQLNDDKSDPQLRLKLPRIFSIIDNKNFKLDNIKDLLTSLRQFKVKHGKHAYNELIDILSILKLSDENKPRPTMQEVLNSLRSIEKTGDLSVQQYIGRSLPPNCTYNPADCRSVMLKPLGVGEILKRFEQAARGVGKKVDSKELNGDNGLNYIVRMIENEEDPIWKAMAIQYVIKIQKEHRDKHIVRIQLAEQGDERILQSIVHNIFCPGSFTDIADSITPMLEYTQQVEIFIDALKSIQTKWPEDLSEVIKQICGDPTQQRSSMQFFNDFLGKTTQTFSKKHPFPADFLAMMLEHEKNHGIQSELLAIDIIFGAKEVSREHKKQILKMNFDSAALRVSAIDFIVKLLKFYSKFASSFTRLLTIIEKCCSDRKSVFDVTLALLQLLIELDNNRLTDQIFALFTGNPTAYLGVLIAIVDIIPKVEKPAEVIKEPGADETRTALVEPVEITEFKMNASHIITRLVFQCCDSSEFEEKQVVHIIKKLTQEKHATLLALIEMLPAPTFKTLKIILTYNSCKEFLENPSDPYYCYRDIAQQFDISRALSVIEEIKDMETGKPLFYSQRQKLLMDFLLINSFGHHPNFPIYLRQKDNGAIKELTCKDLTKAEMRLLVTRCKAVYHDENASAIDKEYARLIFIALVREAVWCITTNFPYSTQVIAILISVMHKGSQLSEIDTGEGKAMVMAMVVTNLWFEITCVNYATSNIELSHVGFEEFGPVFDLLGILRAGNVITSQTTVTEYCFNGINYSDNAQLSLFIAKLMLDPYFIKNYQNEPVSLALDEADHAIFDDDTHYRYATTLHQTDVAFVFETIYKFIHSDKFKDEKATIENDINNARAILVEQATKLQKDVGYISKLSDRQIDTWIESALAATKVKEGKHFVIRTEQRGSGEDAFNISFARILSNSRVSDGAEWGNGVHQFLHTRLNEERITKQRKIPKFPIDPQTAPIASISSKNMIMHHMTRGRVFGVTGTAGSAEEVAELKEQGIKAYRLSPHKPNKRVTDAPILAYGEADHFTRILDKIISLLRQGIYYWSFTPNSKPRPILVGFNDIDKSQRFYDFIHLNIDKLGWYKNIVSLQLLNGSKTMVNNQEISLTEKEFLSKAGVAGCITMSTMLDRGADFKPRLNESDIRQNHPYGLYVLQSFIASLRVSRQMAGRGARQGHEGGYGLVVDQKEFDELLDPSQRNAAAIGKLQSQRAMSEKSKRRFAESLGSVKSFFFAKYIDFVQDEKNMHPDINRKWAECLNNMDIEWNRLILLYRKKKKTEREMLPLCMQDLIRKACVDWNFLVPCDESFMLRPIDVIGIILKPATVRHEVSQQEDCYKLTLELQDVAPARYYVENNPLVMTLGATDEAEIAAINKLVEDKRVDAAYDCIGLILGEVIDSRNTERSLQIAFTNLIEQVYSGQAIPYRKKLLEIFSIGRWSQDEKLQANLTRIFLNRLYVFAVTKLESHVKVNLSIDWSRTDMSKEAIEIEALINFLKDAHANKLKERQHELEEMNLVESAIDGAVAAIAHYFSYDTETSILRRLIELIDHPFTREQEKLSAALRDAESSVLYLGSWCVLFKPPANDISVNEAHETDTPDPDQPAKFILV